MEVVGRAERQVALRQVRAELLAFCEGLNRDEWLAPSRAPGWSVRDVVAHLGAGFRGLFTPALLTVLRSTDIERTNDAMVENRRGWDPVRLLADYRTWSARALRLSSVVSATPARRLRMPLAELGRFRADVLLGSAFVFDHHTHLRYDVAPALGRVVPRADAIQEAVVVEWMMAVLDNQVRAGSIAGLDRPLVIDLGDAGLWTLDAGGVRRGPAARRAAAVAGSAQQLPSWATRRTRWRDAALDLTGDVGYAASLLDQINII